MTIKSVDNGEIVLTFKEITDEENSIEISGREIKRFFEEYKKFQMVTDIYTSTPDAEIIISTAEKHLLNRFKYFPKLPPYDVVKNETE